jgi:hypothetical protein
MKTIILQIGGHSASIGKKGSKVDSQVDELQARREDLDCDIEHIELSAKRSSIRNSIKFLEENKNSNTNLMIVCKSLGCTRLHTIMHKYPEFVIGYRKTAVLTIDGNGGIWYGWYGILRKFASPLLFEEFKNYDLFRHINVYQRNRMLYGGIWDGADNYKIEDPDIVLTNT